MFIQVWIVTQDTNREWESLNNGIEKLIKDISQLEWESFYRDIMKV